MAHESRSVSAPGSADRPSPPDKPGAERRELERLLRRYDPARQSFRRDELLRRLRDSPLAISRARRRRWPTDRARLTLDDGWTVDLQMVWPGAGEPAVLTDLWWHDGLGWIVKVQDRHHEIHTWYAWRLRVR